MDRFGDNLYNTYGSTEVAYASIATPEDMRLEPTTAGKPPWATVVKIFDAEGTELPLGESGRIFVGGAANILDSQRYLRFLVDCASSEGFDTDKLLQAMQAREPALPWTIPRRLRIGRRDSA